MLLLPKLLTSTIHLSNVIQILIIYNNELKRQQTSRGVEATNVPQRGGSESRCNLTFTRDSLMGLFVCVCCVTDDSPVTLFISERVQQFRLPGEVDRPELSGFLQRGDLAAPSVVIPAVFSWRGAGQRGVCRVSLQPHATLINTPVVQLLLCFGSTGVVQGQEQDG